MPLRLLVVDDDPATVVALSDALRLNLREATVVTATSAEDALKILETSNPFEAVLSDVRMPGMSGMNLLSEVKTRYPDCIVFLMTGAECDVRVESLRIGADQFFEKPIDVKRVTHALSQAMESAKLIKALRERNRHSAL